MDKLAWQDNNPKKDLGQKVAEGAAAYERKFGQRPDVVWVNEGVLEGSSYKHGLELGGVRLVASPLCAHSSYFQFFVEESDDVGRDTTVSSVTEPDNDDDNSPVADDRAGDGSGLGESVPHGFQHLDRYAGGVAIRDGSELQIGTTVRSAFRL